MMAFVQRMISGSSSGSSSNNTALSSTEIMNALNGAKENDDDFNAILALAATQQATASTNKETKDAATKLEEENYLFAVEKIKKLLEKYSESAHLTPLNNNMVAYDKYKNTKIKDLADNKSLISEYKQMPKTFQVWLLCVGNTMKNVQVWLLCVDNTMKNVAGTTPPPAGLLADLAILNATLIDQQVRSYRAALPFFNLHAFLQKNATTLDTVNAQLRETELALDQERKRRPESVASVSVKNNDISNIRMRFSLCADYICDERADLIELLISHLMKVPPNFISAVSATSSNGNGVHNAYPREIRNPSAHALEYKRCVMQWVKELIFFKKPLEEIKTEIKNKFAVDANKFNRSPGDDLIRWAEQFSPQEDKRRIDLSMDIRDFKFSDDDLPWAKDYAARLVNWLQCLGDTYNCNTNSEFTELFSGLKKKAEALSGALTAKNAQKI